MSEPLCRSCGSPLTNTVCDLGLSPISNAFIRKDELARSEIFYPLKAGVCSNCWLVQLYSSPSSEAHFHDDYVYFSSFSDSWLVHASRFVECMVKRFKLNEQSKVVELASNDGYLLQFFVKVGIPCLGIEPTSNTAAEARKKGVDTKEVFFGCDTAIELRDDGWQSDILIGNNVLAHVPDICDFVCAMPKILKPEGVITLEFPHLLKFIAENQFDTIYHEHYCYLSLISLLPIFEQAGLRVFDVERLPTHGGSLRLFLCHKSANYSKAIAVSEMYEEERNAGLNKLSTYSTFADNVRMIKYSLLSFVIQSKKEGKKIAAYGAAAKGNTLLNYCGIGTDFIDCIADKNTTKQGRYLPGTRIPVVSPEHVMDMRPDYLLILPWNIKEEIITQMKSIRSWGGKFVIPIPKVEIFQ